ncbi:MAG: serine/threonine protein kinase [Pirellula sp.]
MKPMVDTASRTSKPQSECPSQEILIEYYLGMADEFISGNVDTHISACEPCNQRLAQLESTHGNLLRETLQDPNFQDSADPPLAEAQQAIEAAWQAAQQHARELSATHEHPVTVGQYRILERIGRGGMGSVYRAEHTQLKKVVALKLIPIQWSHPQTLQRFEREIQAAGQLQHPGIVTATDAGSQSGMQYLAMEFVDGLDLGKLMRGISPIPTADACEIARQLALALHHAHQLGMIHRDIKPSNVMLDRAGRVKLLDFGLVHFHRWDGPVGELTTVGQFLGTLDYMAPEQAERSETVDARSDLYSLGATLFKLLTGQTPLAMTPHQSPIEKLKRLSQHQPIHLQTLRPDLPSELCELVNRLLGTQPDSRFPSALHVAEAIQPFCESSDLAALAGRGLQTAFPPDSDPAAPNASRMLPQPSPRGPGRRSPPNLWWLALASLPFLGFFGWRLLLESDQGNLVIESTSDTTKIEVKRRGGGAASEMLVEPGAQLTRLQAGYYEITIHEGSDQLAIEPNQVQLRRGETVVARILRIPKNATAPIPSATLEPSPVSGLYNAGRLSFAGTPLPESVETILYKGKTLSEWLRVLERERDPGSWREAFEACYSTDPKLVHSLAQPLRAMGLQHHFFSVVENGWFLPVFSHEEFDRMVLESMQDQSLPGCLDILGWVAKIPKVKMSNGEGYQAHRLSQSWAFVEQKLSSSSPSSEVLTAIFTSNAFQWIAEIKDAAFFKAHPWLDFSTHRLQIASQMASQRHPDPTIATLLSDPKLDLDRFLFLASFAPVSVSTVDEPDVTREHVRQRLTDELRRWAASGKVFGGLGMGRTMISSGYDGIGFGRSNSTGGMGGGMGGMGGPFGGMNPNDRSERGLQLLALCSGMPREHRPVEAIEQLKTLMLSIAPSAVESKSLGDITWGRVYTFDNEFLGEQTTRGLRKLSEPDVAKGLVRWLSQLQFGDMQSPNDVANAFWFALQNPTERDPLTWVVDSGRNNRTSIERLLKALPSPLVDLELAIDHVEMTNDRNVQRGGLRIGPGMGAGQERIEITLKLEPQGWRVAAFKYGTHVTEF